MPDTELDALLAEVAVETAALRHRLEAMRPQLLAMQELYTAYIDQIRLVLFVAAPPLPSGGQRNLPSDVERECEVAVVKVLKARLAKVNKALGVTTRNMMG